ncbi:hypothetical protein JXA31_08230 [Candidatus Bathyarchaeota archaeon]|nr:hypothetical protein [Candidatus Bathyarchaeota archaeon]
MKRKVAVASFIAALLLLGTQLVSLAVANPIVHLPYITIKSDGTVEPETPFIEQDGNVYTLTSDLVRSYAIKIECSNIIFDGGGHIIDGSLNGYGYSNRGLNVEGVTNVTVKNVEAKGFIDSDVSINYATNSTFLRLKAASYYLRNSNFTTIAESNISSDDSLSFQQLIMLYSNNNIIMGNDIVSLYLDFGYNNTFVKNNFLIGYFSVNGGNFWDDGSLGNYWSGYDGVDVNGDGVGDTPHLINANDQDRFPLMNLWDPVIPYDTVPPLISILSPENKICNESSVPLIFSIIEPASSMSYSLDGRDNITVTGNSTISDLSNGLHNVTVYVKDMCGNVGASETVSFTVEVPFPAAPVTATSVAIVAVVGVGLLVYFKKRKH